LHPDDRERVLRVLAASLKGGGYSIEYRIRHKNGDYHWIEDNNRVVQSETGQPKEAVGVWTDITERKQAEEHVREQADIINRAHDAIIIRNFKDRRIVFWNHGAERLYGWTSAERVGEIEESIFTQPEQVETMMKTLLVTGEFRGEFKQLAKDGRKLITEGRATLVRNADGTPRSILIICTDVTEQKKLETHLLRAQRLESIGTLASGVAHDLNNVLTPIMMCTEVLRDNLNGADMQSTISLIEDSARRGAGIVKQVLTFARGVEGERVLIKPSHLIEEMIDIARKTFPKSIEISSRYPEDLWSIEGDPTQLHQVLLNLSVNARDAMPEGGSLVISAENLNVDENYASMTPDAKVGACVMISVSDTGAGMPRATIDKIFDPFFTTKETGKGTGLGLSTSLGILKSHGGSISVYSDIGKGTTFKILLPGKPDGGARLESKTPPESLAGNGELVLVVDDEPSILRVTKMILEAKNYQVLCANDGTEALAVFAKQMDSISVVLTDLTLPYMDGVAIIRAFKKMKPDMHFIASSGHGEETRVSELEALHVKNFLTKPYDTEKLLMTLNTALKTQTAS
jgi:PAS domain S-box-containing protein